MNKEWIYLIVGIILLGAIFFIGRLTVNKPLPLSSDTTTAIDTIVQRDTIQIFVTKTITKALVNNYNDDDILNLLDSLEVVIEDSIKGIKDSTYFSVKHRLIGLRSDWEIDIKPFMKNIIKTKTETITNTITNTEYISKPMLLNEWFWIATLEFIIVVSSLIIAIF
jgi:hypothetical protein